MDDEYDIIRNSLDDVEKISEATGILEWRIGRIKNHVFNNTHILRDGVKRFYPDEEIIDVWYRLQDGSFNSNDLDLLNHEIFEAKFEGIYGTDYDTAHGKTIESGRDWNPYK